METWKKDLSENDGTSSATSPSFIQTETFTSPSTEHCEMSAWDWCNPYLGNNVVPFDSWQPSREGEGHDLSESWFASHMDLLPYNASIASASLPGLSSSPSNASSPSFRAQTDGSSWTSTSPQWYSTDDTIPLHTSQAYPKDIPTVSPSSLYLSPLPPSHTSLGALHPCDPRYALPASIHPIQEPCSFSMNPLLDNTEMRPYLEVSSLDMSPSADAIHPSPEEERAYKNNMHNVIERRYRNNINDRIAELTRSVPALRHARLKSPKTKNRPHLVDPDDQADQAEYLDGVAVATKLNKATILHKATEYIGHLKRQREHARKENEALISLIAQQPGGQQALGRHAQSIQYDKSRQALLSRTSAQRKQARCKRVRPNNSDATSTTSKSAPHTRVFMVFLMAMGFFTTSQLGAGPSNADQFHHHNHISRSTSPVPDTLAPSSNACGVPHWVDTVASVMDGTFPPQGVWSTLQTTCLIIGIAQLVLPLISLLRSCSAFKVRRFQTTRHRRHVSCLRHPSSGMPNNLISPDTRTISPGDKKCMQIYDILIDSLEKEDDAPPKGILMMLLCLVKETTRFFLRSWLGYDILEARDLSLSPHDAWVRACKWAKLNEVECLGGNPSVSRLSMLYSCIKGLNIVEACAEGGEGTIMSSRSRVYVTAAMKMALIFPTQGLATWCSRSFWRQAMYGVTPEDESFMQALVFDCHRDDGEDRMEAMLHSRAWSETLKVMHLHVGHPGHPDCLPLSLTAPVLVPAAILSTYHLLDNLQTQFGRLLISLTATPITAETAPKHGVEFSETAFDAILALTALPRSGEDSMIDSHQHLAHWLAAVGATVEALWKSDVATAERLIATLMQYRPDSLVARRTAEISYMDHHNILVKKRMVHILFGATLLKQAHGTTDSQHRGLQELYAAGNAHLAMKKLAKAKPTDEHDLESSVMTLAEFAVSLTLLEAWIAAWRLTGKVRDPSERAHWEYRAATQVHLCTLHLRRMTRHDALNRLRASHSLVTRLTRLGSLVTCQSDQANSAYDGSDTDNANDDDDDDGASASDNDNDSPAHTATHCQQLTKRADRALAILRGLV